MENTTFLRIGNLKFYSVKFYRHMHMVREINSVDLLCFFYNKFACYNRILIDWCVRLIHANRCRRHFLLEIKFDAEYKSTTWTDKLIHIQKLSIFLTGLVFSEYAQLLSWWWVFNKKSTSKTSVLVTYIHNLWMYTTFFAYLT